MEYKNHLISMIPVLQDAHKKRPIEPRIEKLETLISLVEGDNFINYEPYLVNNILPIVLQRLDDKPKVMEIANNLLQKLMSKLSIQAFPLILNVLSKEMQIESKWRSKIGSLKLLSLYLNRVNNLDRDLLSACLPQLVKILTPMLHDTKLEVAEEASIVCLFALKGITNRDLEPFIEDLLLAMKVREETEETIQKLGGVVFVQTVEGSALSVVVPLMIAGFRTNKALVKRMCARIVSNMSKLVEEPLEALPFLEELIPTIYEAIGTIADPEAREVAEKTHEELLVLQKKGEQMEKKKQFRKTEIIEEEVMKKLGNVEEEYAKYLATITSSLISTKTTDEEEYNGELKNYLPEEHREELLKYLYQESKKVINIEDENNNLDEDGEELCDCEFTLAYGTKILLHNTKLKLKKGRKYGLLGQNDCGKTTLMKAIADGSVDGFPDASEVKTVFVEADIQGELSHLDCVNYVLEFQAIKNLGATEQQVRDILKQVGFTEGKSAGAGGDCDDPISSLSGGWRMKLALARAMLQKADILLMDEPTNHLDVKNVKWVESYINSLKDTTVVMVSHDSGLLDNCCDYILQIDKLKLKLHKGNLTEFVKGHPEAKSYFEFKASKVKFSFPPPCFLDGVKSRGKALMKMDNVSLTYPKNTVPTIQDITIRASMASRVACVGINGAGKSTMIKVLTGELEPTTGKVWKYPNTRVGYIAQHAFHHIENHLQKTPNEYIRWRFEFGDDREGLDKATMKLSDKDKEELGKEVQYSMKNEKGQIKKDNRVIKELTGQRREQEGRKKDYEYEVKWKDKDFSQNSWLSEETLIKYSKIYDKVLRMIDHKITSREQMAIKPLTQENVEKHLGSVGLESEYATHFRINALSGGQKVKVVLAAAMWDQPHILILDEPTNYLDRDSLGALAEAIEVYEGGVIMITHNDAFCRQLCPERWVLEKGRLNTEGDVEWMKKMTEQAVEFKQVDEMIDASGNEVKIKRRKKMNAKEKKKMIKLINQKVADGEDLDSEEEEYAIEWNL
jgi:elongation factor 3